uniref:Uncharacterized protein n=1 Tax=Euplotes crassus TaxID=5936 RepID=A0A7S3KSD1_EUPCR|mmetsp:Transcript_6175/g.5773  ORF Transcript_6175/g.5773 Transcript_6175/m.5773 type:complete len:236 (+) Transcript_6175:415-1122(+)
MTCLFRKMNMLLFTLICICVLRVISITVFTFVKNDNFGALNNFEFMLILSFTELIPVIMIITSFLRYMNNQPGTDFIEESANYAPHKKVSLQRTDTVTSQNSDDVNKTSDQTQDLIKSILEVEEKRHSRAEEFGNKRNGLSKTVDDPAAFEQASAYRPPNDNSIPDSPRMRIMARSKTKQFEEQKEESKEDRFQKVEYALKYMISDNAISRSSSVMTKKSVEDSDSSRVSQSQSL